MSLERLEWPRLTAHLTVRPARAADAADIWAWHQHREVTSWMPRLVNDEAAFTERFGKHLDQTVVALQSGRVVGSAKIALQNAWAQDEVATQAAGSEAEIGWVLDPEVQGRGLGTELAAELLAICLGGLGLHRVVAICFAENTASWKVMEKVGMRREAHYRADSLHRDGHWHDSYSYAILASEWSPSSTGH
jgi:RimJ/RimL family protein N-acetyltransferase